ncbi:tellurite resistance/C4-dicarboxylate transporter family protein [Hymenobacter antarcticus]
MWKSAVQQFPPAYFTMVMATGIISLAAHGLRLEGVANGFFYLNLGLYPLFVLLLLGRVLGFFAGVRAELASHETGASYLALVPATCMVGNQFAVLRGNPVVGEALWVAGALCWGLLLYAFLLGVMTRREKPPLETALTGSWLLLVVATQSLAVLGATLLPGRPPDGTGVFVVLSLFLLGSLLYVMLSTLLFYRLAFGQLSAGAVSAPYWISVGGSAISALAGASLLGALRQTPALADVAGVVKGVSVLFWAVSTWWIPLVFTLRAWHHLRGRPAFAYRPTDWSMVFPLGMYTAATWRLAAALPLPALHVVAAYFIYVALLAWGLTLGAMLYHLARGAGRLAAGPPNEPGRRPAVAARPG